MAKNDQVAKNIQLMYTRYLKSANAFQRKKEFWVMLDTFDRGEQWDRSAIPPWVPKPVTNYIRYVRTLKRANLASSIPSPSFSPELPEDQPIIDQLQHAHDHVWESERVDRVIRRCIDRALLQGTAIAMVYSDDSFVGGRYYGSADPTASDYHPMSSRNSLYQGKICVKRWPNERFFIDPDAYRLEDAKWIDTTEPIPLKQLKETPEFIEYCRQNGTLKKLQALQGNQLEMNTDGDGDIYTRDVTLAGNSALPGDEMVTVHTHWERYLKNGKWRLDITYYVRNTDFYLLRLEDVQPSEYPFAVLYDEEEENEFWGTSTCMDIIENQKVINKVQQTASIIAVLHQNPQKVVNRESGINAEELANTGTLPGKVWVSNIPAEQAIAVVRPADIPRGLQEMDQSMQTNIREMVGVNEAYTGESVGSLTTSTGVSSLIERATIRDKDKMIQIDAFVERLSHLIVLHILYKWQDRRPIVRQGLDGKPDFAMYQPIDPIIAENLTWRVHSDIYAKAPTTQEARRQWADKTMQMQLQFQPEIPILTPMEWMRMQDCKDANLILQRMERDMQTLQAQKAQNLAQIIVQVAQQIHQGQLQGLDGNGIQQQALQIAQEILDKQQAQDMRSGITPQATPTLPKGVTSQVAMANMASGT